MPRIFLATNPDHARDLRPDVTIEAEYGGVVVEGRLYTAAHHQPSGPYQGRHTGGTAPAPCNNPEIPVLIDDEIVILSHLDLDSIGGTLRAIYGDCPLFDHNVEFWNRAEWVDTNGVHRFDREDDLYPVFAAWWAWLEEHRPEPDHTRAVNVTAFIETATGVLWDLLAVYPTRESLDRRDVLMAAGEAFTAREDALNTESFYRSFNIGSPDDSILLITRKSDQSTYHLYRLPPRDDGKEVEVADAILSLNTKHGSITLSFADGGERYNAREIVRFLWPDKDDQGRFLAGGHPGIAGCPRNLAADDRDLHTAFLALIHSRMGEEPERWNDLPVE